MVNLNGHAAGNGGHSQRTPKAHRGLLYSEGVNLLCTKTGEDDYVPHFQQRRAGSSANLDSNDGARIMGITNLYSKRKKKERGEVPDVFVYDEVPDPLRAQIVHILRDAIGNPRADYSRAGGVYADIIKALCREYGIFEL